MFGRERKSADFGSDDAEHGALVLAIVGGATTISVHAALIAVRLISWARYGLVVLRAG